MGPVFLIAIIYRRMPVIGYKMPPGFTVKFTWKLATTDRFISFNLQRV